MLALVLLAACATTPGPSPSLTLGAVGAGEPPPPGTASGTIYRLVGGGFEPAAGAQVALVGAPPASADAAGRYALSGLAPGAHDLEASLAGHLGAPLRVRLSAAMGVARADLVLVPAGGGLPDRTIAGVVADPRGAALPGAEVRLVDSLSASGAGGNQQVRADAVGRFLARLPAVGTSALTAGVAYLTATGVTPGGVRVETSRVAPLALDDRAHVPVALIAEAFRPPMALTAVAPDRVRASGLPARRDELVVRWSGPSGQVEQPPAAITDGEVQVTLPAGCCAGEGRLGLLVFGIADDAAAPTLPWPPGLP